MNDIRQAILDAADDVDDAVDEEDTLDEGLDLGAADDSSEDIDDTETTLTEESDDPVEASAATEEVTTDTGDKPPLGWSPENRESWAALGEGVKSQITKREAEMETFMRDSAQGRRDIESFHDMVEPYRALIQQEGARDPMEAIQGLFRTASTLASGSQQQKAQRIAQMIGHYGVDIESLDNILSNTPQAAANPQQDAVQAAINARLQPMENMFKGLQDRQNESNYQNQQRLNDDIAGFEATAEFFEDVRLDMADIMDMASNRGQTIDMQQAYDKACALHPEISKVVASRARQSDLGIKKSVSSQTVNGSMGGEGGVSTAGSLRSMIETAWDGG